MNVLVTGSARGLGLELVKQLTLINETKGGGLVIATGRKSSPDLEKVIAESNGSAIFVALDVANEETVVQSATDVKAALKGESLDVLINCAGVHGETKEKLAEMSDLDFQLSVNVSGAHRVIREYLPLMGGSSIKKVANISSVYGSVTSAEAVSYAPCPAYKISKAALNALTVQYALSYRDEGFVFFSVNPGWLQTDMGGQNADLTVPQGAEAVLNVVMSARKEDNGHFKNIDVAGWEQYNGMDLPW